jgi:hypothetical protein
MVWYSMHQLYLSMKWLSLPCYAMRQEDGIQEWCKGRWWTKAGFEWMYVVTLKIILIRKWVRRECLCVALGANENRSISPCFLPAASPQREFPGAPP